MTTDNPNVIVFKSRMDQLGLSNRTQRVLVQYGFTSIEEVRDYINDFGLSSLRTAKAGFWRIVCEELSRLPYLIQTFQEAKRVIALVESLQSEIELNDLMLDHLATIVPNYEEECEKVRNSPEYRKLVSRSTKI